MNDTVETNEQQTIQECKVPYVDLGNQTAEIKKELLNAVEKVLDSGHYILGPHVAQFEKEFSQYCQAQRAVGIANGTSSLYLVLKSLGIQKGDEVITAPNSFIASASSIALTGAKPTFVDIRSDMNMDPNKLESAITPQTKAIIPVHLTGRPAAMPEILEIAKKYNLFVLEDAAQAVGATLNNKRVGSWGDAASFSLHPLKNLFAYGDAGIVTTQREDIYENLLIARNHGLKNRSDCEFFSFNERLDELHAAMLSIQLKHFEKWTAKRRELAFRYNQELKKYVEVPEEGAGEYCVYQTYMVKADQRDSLLAFLNANKVDAKVHYPTPIYLQEAARYLGHQENDFPETLRASQRIISLPLYPTMTNEQQHHVIDLIRKFYARRKN